MTFSTYSDLKTNMADWLARDDLTSNLDNFITLFESAINRKLFRVRQKETTATLTPSSGTVALPSDYLSAIRLTWTGSPRIDLDYVHPSYLQMIYPTSPTDVPRIYTIEGSNILVRPVNDTALELLYNQKTAALSGSLNWLYTNYPDVYLAGSLVEAYQYLKDTENMAIWGTRLETALTEIRSNTFNQAGNMTIKVMGFTP
jgi:hypothetical protein